MRFSRDTFFVRAKFKEQRAKFKSKEIFIFPLLSFLFHLSSLLVPLAAAVARVVFQHSVGYVAVREYLNRAVVVA